MKPSYEELEEQLNRSRRLCDAALANERAWETAMMHACGEDGPKSVADKFAELEQKLIESERYGRQTDITIDNLEMKLAQMAAENAGLKAAHPQPFGPEMMKALDAYEKHQDETPETGMLDAFFILRDSIRVKTPATDAFLAELRAQGAEMFAAYCGEENSVFVEAKAYYRSLPDAAYEFAAQLRKGVQS
ncbi:hypothetical protein ABKT96_05150 [Enterobacter kobei]|uniref:hypothetical protein n=1 Tax=Enterobacter kobei TaxID=208224 RepID=UPI0032AFF8C6